MITFYKGLIKINYLAGFNFHSDIDRFLYYADSPKQNYHFDDLFSKLKIMVLSGNVQNGVNIYSNEEPSALYTSYKVCKPNVFTRQTKLPYYPRYRALNPYQRYGYLKFLENPYLPAPLSYVYLLLYCLERRLSEGNEDVIPVMLKLADSHGDKFKLVVNDVLRKYELWKAGSRTPENMRVFCNYTLYIGCHDTVLD